MDVAADVDPVFDALRQTFEGGAGVGEPRRIVVRRHAVLGHEHGYSRVLRGQPNRVAERLGIHLPAGLHGGHPFVYRQLTVWSDAGPGVRLHADEVVVGRDGQPVGLAQPPRFEPPFLSALRGLQVDERQGPSRLDGSGRRLDRLYRQTMRVCHLLEARRHDPHPITGRVVPSDPTVSLLDGFGCGRTVARPHGEDPGAAHHRHQVGLVQRADPRQEVTDVLGHRSGVGGEPFRRVRRPPTASSCHPAGDREVVVGHHRRDALVQAALDHPLVMVECGARVEARLRFDS